jgi:TolB-like protein
MTQCEFCLTCIRNNLPMSSLIEGYNYDIFISYRQKDNKHDGWVTEFVNNLKGELESTFKEEIGVYFDINPHDGLLETHDVDASLKEKLKCLIFIPIISRTYCDPKSFAWEHEFKAFVEMASKDQFGLKVKLPNGNVASRVLPIRIYDLSNADIKLCENLFGGYFRNVEFVFERPGVNRPLRPEDDEKINLKKNGYRDQINKVGNAIQEIVSGLRKEPIKPISERKEGLFIEDKIIRQKSIIVLPFDNLSSDPEQEYFSDGLTEEIITDLSYIHNLLVISRSSAMTFKGSNKTIPEIAREVNVRYVLEGSVRKSGNNLRIIAQLIDAVADTHIWAEKYNGTLDDIFEIQEKVAQSISAALKLKITSMERSKITEVPIADINSYQLYLQAKSYAFTFTEAGLDKATRLINQALENSGENALLYASRAIVQWQYHNAGFKPIPDILDIAEGDVKKSLELDSNCVAAYEAKAYIAYTKGDLEVSVTNFRKSHSAESQSMLGYIYALAGQKHLAKEHTVQGVQSDPLNPMILATYAFSEIFSGNFASADNYLLKACELTNENSMYHYYHSLILIYSGDSENALSTCQLLNQRDSGIFGEMAKMWKAAVEKKEPDFENQVQILKEYGLHDKEVSWWIADCSALMGKVEDTFYWLNNSIEQGLINDVFFSKFDPILAILRDDPRFVALMDKAKEKQHRFKINLEK